MQFEYWLLLIIAVETICFLLTISKLINKEHEINQLKKRLKYRQDFIDSYRNGELKLNILEDKDK